MNNISTTAVVIGYDTDGTGNPLIVVKYKVDQVELISNDYKHSDYLVEIGDTVSIKYYEKDFNRIIIDW